MAAKFQQLRELFPDANVVSMVESDATLLLYDYTSVSVKVRRCRVPFGYPFTRSTADALTLLLLLLHVLVLALTLVRACDVKAAADASMRTIVTWRGLMQ